MDTSSVVQTALGMKRATLEDLVKTNLGIMNQADKALEVSSSQPSSSWFASLTGYLQEEQSTFLKGQVKDLFLQMNNTNVQAVSGQIDRRISDLKCIIDQYEKRAIAEVIAAIVFVFAAMLAYGWIAKEQQQKDAAVEAQLKASIAVITNELGPLDDDKERSDKLSKEVQKVKALLLDNMKGKVPNDDVFAAIQQM